MTDGKPTYDQLCKIIGSVYADAYLRIEFLENENRQLREDQQTTVASLRSSLDKAIADRDSYKVKFEGKQSVWNNGSGNSMLPESFLAKHESGLTAQSSTLSPQPANSD